MESYETKRLQKVNAERGRRFAFNQRLLYIRELLRMNKKDSRLNILKQATLTASAISTQHACFTIFNQPLIGMQNNNLMDKRLMTVQNNKTLKASNEQYRRYLERLELNKLRRILSIDKISDVQLLDKFINLFKNKENLSVHQNHNRMATVNKPIRVGLRPIDLNANAQNLSHCQNALNQMLHYELQTKKVSNYWRPWEELTSK